MRFDLYNIDSYELIVKTHAENKLSRMDRSPPFCTAQFRNPDHNPDYTALNPSFKIIKKSKNYYDLFLSVRPSQFNASFPISRPTYLFGKVKKLN